MEGYGPQISKLGPTTKMGPVRKFLQYFHPKRNEIDEKLYNDLIWINPPQFGRLLVPKIFY
jgi:hypothetical protein